MVIQCTYMDATLKRQSLQAGQSSPWLDGVREYAPNARIEIVSGAGHFVHMWVGSLARSITFVAVGYACALHSAVTRMWEPRLVPGVQRGHHAHLRLRREFVEGSSAYSSSKSGGSRTPLRDLGRSTALQLRESPVNCSRDNLGSLSDFEQTTGKLTELREVVCFQRRCLRFAGRHNRTGLLERSVRR